MQAHTPHSQPVVHSAEPGTDATPPATSPARFSLVLIKPSHYDDDGYVIQWFRSAVPSNSLAVMHGLCSIAAPARCSVPMSKSTLRSMDEDNTRIRIPRLVHELTGRPGLVVLVGVQSNQFPRAMDIARPLRAVGVQVCMGGFHVSGSISMLGGVTPELQQAIDIGISLFAGEAEENRLDQVLRDARDGALKPLYNYLNNLPLSKARLPRCFPPPPSATPSASTPASTPAAAVPSSAPSAPSSTSRAAVPPPYRRRGRADHSPQPPPGRRPLLHHSTTTSLATPTGRKSSTASSRCASRKS